MITAIAMINCEKGQVHSVAETLVDVDGVAEVYSVSGEYDIMAVIRVKQYESLSKVVSLGISPIDGITKTNTHMAFRCYSKHNMERMWADIVAE